MAKKKADPDFLDEMIAEGEARSPGFANMVEAALQRRLLLRRLAEERARAGVSQTELAVKMGTSQSAVARLERGASDTKLSTVERFATALGKRVEFRVVPAPRQLTLNEKLRIVRETKGAWKDRTEDGEAYVERLRSGRRSRAAAKR